MRWAMNLYREIKRQWRFYRDWSILGENLKRFRNIPDKKPWFTIARELVRCTIHYRCIPDQYFRYDVFRKGVASEKVLDYVPDYVMAMKWFPVVNNHFKQHQLLLNNKIFFKQFLRQAGLPVATPYVYVLNRTFYTPDMEMIDIGQALERLNGVPARRLFCKSDILEGARGIICFERVSADEPFKAGDTILNESYLNDIANRGGYLFEEGIEQHPVLADMNPGSLNTFRIVTQFHPGAEATILYAILRMGTGTSYFDNVCKGGVFVVLDAKTGKVQLPAYDRLCDSYNLHPTTNMPFAELDLPFYHEIADLARKAATKFPTLASIGWDIGYTADGPVFIEGNDRWGAALYQLAIGGIAPVLKREWFADGNIPR